MLSEELKTIEVGGMEYPYKCDLIVLEKMQLSENGDLNAYECKLRGRKENSDGTVEYKVPDLQTVCEALSWMVAEGIETKGLELEAPSAEDIARGVDYSVQELFSLAIEEYNTCFLSKGQKAARKSLASKKKKDEGN